MAVVITMFAIPGSKIMTIRHARTRENWLGLVNDYVYSARQTREINLVSPGTASLNGF